MPDHRTRSTESRPSNRLQCLERIVFDNICANQASSSTQSRLAMHSQCIRRFLANMQKFHQNRIARCAPVDEIQIPMIETAHHKTIGLVHAHVQPHHRFHIVLPEIVKVLLRRMVHVAIFYFRFLVRSAECDELLRQQPVQIAVLHELKHRLFFFEIKIKFRALEIIYLKVPHSIHIRRNQSHRTKKNQRDALCRWLAGNRATILCMAMDRMMHRKTVHMVEFHRRSMVRRPLRLCDSSI